MWRRYFRRKLQRWVIGLFYSWVNQYLSTVAEESATTNRGGGGHVKSWFRGGAAGVASKQDQSDAPDRSSKAAPVETLIPRWKPLAHLVDSERFQIFIGVVIVANALVLGLQTYSGIEASYGRFLQSLNAAFYIVFVVELITRILSYGTRPWNFFRNGWNIFDFIVIGGALIPGLRDQATIIRLLRLARIVRLMRFLPDARILILTVSRATPAVASMSVLTVLVLFIYGIVGWSMFGQALPEQWGNIGTAMLTLFVLLTLEGFPEYLAAARTVNDWAPIFFLTYVLIAAFIIVNLLIGIVISAMERAREQEAIEARKVGQDHLAALLEHLTQARQQIDEIEGEVEIMRSEGYFTQGAAQGQAEQSNSKYQEAGGSG